MGVLVLQYLLDPTYIGDGDNPWTPKAWSPSGRQVSL